MTAFAIYFATFIGGLVLIIQIISIIHFLFEKWRSRRETKAVYQVMIERINGSIRRAAVLSYDYEAAKISCQLLDPSCKDWSRASVIKIANCSNAKTMKVLAMDPT